jgi:hypothetical protein
MRALTTVGLKLMGISSLYWATGFVPSLFSALFMFSNPHPGLNPVWYVAQIVTYFGINVLFALVLLFRTEWVVAKLQIPPEPISLSIAASELLRVGLVLVGVFAIIHALSEFGGILFSAIQDSRMPNQPSGFSSYHMGRMIEVLLELLLGAIVIGDSRGIVSRVFPSNGNRR